MAAFCVSCIVHNYRPGQVSIYVLLRGYLLNLQIKNFILFSTSSLMTIEIKTVFKLNGHFIFFKAASAFLIRISLQFMYHYLGTFICLSATN